MYKPHKSHKPKKNVNHVLDSLIYPVAILSPIMTIPQISEIWLTKSAKLSLVTWGSYAIVSGFWLIYGINHKEKPIIVGNSLSIITYSLVVIGILLFGK